MTSESTSGIAPLQCSFCGKSAADVAQLVADGAAHICNECLGISRRLVGERIDPLAIAELRIAAFHALKGWGATGPDGKWASWNNGALRLQAEKLVDWALSRSEPALAAPSDNSTVAT